MVCSKLDGPPVESVCLARVQRTHPEFLWCGCGGRRSAGAGAGGRGGGLNSARRQSTNSLRLVSRSSFSLGDLSRWAGRSQSVLNAEATGCEAVARMLYVSICLDIYTKPPAP